MLGSLLASVWRVWLMFAMVLMLDAWPARPGPSRPRSGLRPGRWQASCRGARIQLDPQRSDQIGQIAALRCADFSSPQRASSPLSSPCATGLLAFFAGLGTKPPREACRRHNLLVGYWRLLHQRIIQYSMLCAYSRRCRFRFPSRSTPCCSQLRLRRGARHPARAARSRAIAAGWSLRASYARTGDPLAGAECEIPTQPASASARNRAPPAARLCDGDLKTSHAPNRSRLQISQAQSGTLSSVGHQADRSRHGDSHSRPEVSGPVLTKRSTSRRYRAETRSRAGCRGPLAVAESASSKVERDGKRKRARG